MPFIDTKVTMKVSPEKKEIIKQEMGKRISALNKTETYLMVGIEDGYDLWFGGKKLDKGAYVAVSLLGDAPKECYEKMTRQVCDLMAEQLDIPGKVGIGLARGSEKVAKRIFELLADGPMRPSALREAVGIRSRVHFSRCYMTPLVEKGLVARTDPDKPMSPRQEYKLA